jgi:hypothetical protein
MAVTGSTNQTQTQEVYSSYAAQATQTTKTQTSKTNSYGKTIGQPQLSEEASKYYEQLKKKYGNMDFILVSKDMKAAAQASAASYANSSKTVVLIDEEKIEKMATDASYREKYESIISNAASGISQLKAQIEKTGANVQGYGMQVNDGGTASFFAVLKKSSADQKARIEKKAAEKKAEKKAAEKKAAKKEAEERLEKAREESKEVPEEDEDTITITASSIEELMQKISDYQMEQRSDEVMTPEEMQIGGNIDFRG